MHEKIRAYLTPQEYNLILENSCADLFATDGRGRIIYANDDSVRVLGCPLEKLLTMDIYQLRAEGYVSYSMTDEVLHTRKQAMGTISTRPVRRWPASARRSSMRAAVSAWW